MTTTIAGGRFELLAPIAEGGMATLHLARFLRGAPPAEPLGGIPPIAPPPPGAAVAVKMIRDEFSLHRDFVNSFLDEARIVSRLKHKNIVQIYELGMHGERIFIAMELLVGQTLLELAEACSRRGTKLPLAVLAWIVARAADALHSAHESRDKDGAPLELIHRDVNPSNIFITFKGAVKVIDFGLAKARGRVSRTNVGIVKGKLAYMAPEQAALHPPRLDRRVDVYALGITLWELSLGRRLFKRDTDMATVLAAQRGDVPDPLTLDPDYPRALRNTVMSALAKTPIERHATAAELAAELDVFARNSLAAPERAVVALVDEMLAEEHGRQLAWFGRAVTKPQATALRPSMPPQA